MAYLFESFLHDVWSVIDSQNNVCNAGGSEAFDLVKDHGSIGKFNQWLGESEGLSMVKELVENLWWSP